MKTLETEHLLLRPFVLEDIDVLYQEIYSDIEVVRYYSHKGVQTREATLQHLTTHLASWRDPDDAGNFVTILDNFHATCNALSNIISLFFRRAIPVRARLTSPCGDAMNFDRAVAV